MVMKCKMRSVKINQMSLLIAAFSGGKWNYTMCAQHPEENIKLRVTFSPAGCAEKHCCFHAYILYVHHAILKTVD